MKKFIKKHKTLKKAHGSYEFPNSRVLVDAKQQDSAEELADQDLINYIKSSVKSDIAKIPFKTGTLTLYPRDTALYSGFFQDKNGQIVEQLNEMTIAMVAKFLITKGYYEVEPDYPVEDVKKEEIKGFILR